MLIGQDGEKHGVFQLMKLLKKQKMSLDLVQVSAKDADPVVCKLLDYGKFVFTKKKYSIFKC